MQSLGGHVKTWEGMRDLGRVGSAGKELRAPSLGECEYLSLSSWEGMERMQPVRSEEDRRVEHYHSDGVVRKVNLEPETGDRQQGQESYGKSLKGQTMRK